MGRIVARGLLYVFPEALSMKSHSEKDLAHDDVRVSETDREESIRRSLDEQSGDHDTFNPRTGEDPGLLPLTEDPRERRLKRHTM
jgi:hypothetical protein